MIDFSTRVWKLLTASKRASSDTGTQSSWSTRGCFIINRIVLLGTGMNRGRQASATAFLFCSSEWMSRRGRVDRLALALRLSNCTWHERLASQPSGPKSSGSRPRDWPSCRTPTWLNSPFRSPLSPDYNSKPSSQNTHLGFRTPRRWLDQTFRESFSRATLFVTHLQPATASFIQLSAYYNDSTSNTRPHSSTDPELII